MILITGGRQGIGLECAKRVLAQTTTEVMITGRDSDGLVRARETLPLQLRDRLLLKTCDQGDPSDVRALCDLVADPTVTLEAAVLAVGVNPLYTEGAHRLDRVSAATIETTIRTNCTHALLLSAALLGRFRLQGGGVLIWIGSRGYQVGLPGAALYCATKAFLSGLAVTAHLEYSRSGIRVHLVNPGRVRTPRTEGLAETFAARRGFPIADAGAVAERITAILLDDSSAAVEVDL